MIKQRIIPCLLLSNGGLVKTQQFKRPKYIGDPINAIKILNEKEVDELMVLDISASKMGKEPDYDLIEQFASECFMPLCYGGGIKNIAQAKRIFSSGVEKVCLQTAVLEDTSLIKEIAEHFGSQSVVISVDVKSGLFGKNKLYSSCYKKTLSILPSDFLNQCILDGAGEVLLNSVDLDGTMKGMDYSLIRDISSKIPVPLIAIGGVGSLCDIKKAFASGASAVAAGSIFVFHGPHRAVLITYPTYDEIETCLGT